ncbi:indolepyruvate oxidoreductase subunit beta family protein [Paracoccus versutus]|uniref:indolepyruvate oxidoreductase subunit beta family protein n=1 Tax=Paracoccus versutus TaxID=34007 RepID=UPI001FB58B80|nr:indolepyruvate oxidoreductase subunit beta family protein [Paracoccus versutus]MCJ1901686.1 indolepyruvate oxidoreductase subunit beta family protein [Paracoccus versutus]
MNALTNRPTGVLVLDKPISIAILAMGGQGGGVLADWIVSVAESQGWAAQSTSVPGVAQRTGATIYYVEMMPLLNGKRPVFSLMPTPGDVDIVLAAEFMEAGRAILRGFVNPEQTVLIASNHRSFAVVEKQVPGNGEGESMTVVEAAGIAAKKTIAFDMQAVAEDSGTVISAALFGALCGAAVLPFGRDVFETAVRASGKGVDASLRAFAQAHDMARTPPPVAPKKAPEKVLPPLPTAPTGNPGLDALVRRVRAEYPISLHPMLFAGMKRLVDYQDTAYAHEYLDRLATLHARDAACDGEAQGYAFTEVAAKYLAVAMAYDDVIRVADLKTRASRFRRVQAEVGVSDTQILYTTEYMHPRMEEITGFLPARLGRAIESRQGLYRALDRVVNRGRRVRTGTIFWFVTLYALGRARRLRRLGLRHEREIAHIETWLATALDQLPTDYALATEILRSRRLVKGYSDTHSRGLSKFDRVMAQVPRLSGLPGAAGWLALLNKAALLDEEGTALGGAILSLDAELGK